MGFSGASGVTRATRDAAHRATPAAFIPPRSQSRSINTRFVQPDKRERDVAKRQRVRSAADRALSKSVRWYLAWVALAGCSGRQAPREVPSEVRPAEGIDAGSPEPAPDAGEPARDTGCAPRAADRVCLPAAIAQFGRSAPEAHFEERPARAARLRGFEIDRDEVSAQRYRACVDAGRCAAPHCDDGALLGAEGPARCVSWSEARAACAFLGGRLPSEAEWERAAAGALPFHHAYPWGDDAGPWVDARVSAWRDADEPAPITDETDDGVRNLGGGVAEWVDDVGAFYLAPPRHDAGVADATVEDGGSASETAEREFADAGLELPGDSGLPLVDDPRGPREGPWRVVRGGDDAVPFGGWTTSRRRFRLPGDRRVWIGFRCVYDLPTTVRRDD
jgi:formylglycine-generating enzyme required for sulfatase activity